MKIRKLLVAVFLSLGMTTIAATSNSQSNATIWDGVYSVEQAARGKEVYNVSCVSCHAADLRGDSNAPGLTGMGFMFLWEGRSVGELYSTIQSQMPSENPNSLSAQRYRDVVSYILQANNFPPGNEDLSSNVDLLNAISITPESSR